MYDDIMKMIWICTWNTKQVESISEGLVVMSILSLVAIPRSFLYAWA